MTVVAIHEAKANLSRYVRESSERHRVFMVRNGQRRDAPGSWLVGERVVEEVLNNFTFHPQWEFDEEQSLWSVVVPEIDVWGQGETKDQAVQDVLEAVAEYAEVYANDMELYLKVGRGHHLPYLWRIWTSGGDASSVRTLLGI